MGSMVDLNNWIKSEITHYAASSPENTLSGYNEPAWLTPLVAIADGSNFLFYQYKELIGDFYWTPLEILQKVYPLQVFDPQKIQIVCWVLPQTEATRLDQRQETELPADRWIYSRHYGERFNELLRKRVEDLLKTKGVLSVSPVIHKDFGYQESPAFGIASNWSERHTAYAAGLGSFALCDGFITDAGKAVRIGSTVVYDALIPENLPVKGRHDNCLYYAKGICGVCAKRCPVDAINKEAGHDKSVCFQYIRGVTAPHAEKLLGAYQTPCGLCQAKVPCEFKNPVMQAW